MMLLFSVSHTVRIHCLTFFSMKRQKSIKRAGKKKKKEKAFWINCDRAKCFCLKKHLLVCFSMSFWYAAEWEINCFVWFWTFQQEIKTYKLQLFERFSLMRNSWVKKKSFFLKSSQWGLVSGGARRCPGASGTLTSLSLGCTACCREYCHPCARDKAASPQACYTVPIPAN